MDKGRFAPAAPVSPDQWKAMRATLLHKFGACEEARAWMGKYRLATPQELWDRCPRVEWLTWFLGETEKEILPLNPTHAAAIRTGIAWFRPLLRLLTHPDYQPEALATAAALEDIADWVNHWVDPEILPEELHAAREEVLTLFARLARPDGRYYGPLALPYYDDIGHSRYHLSRLIECANHHPTVNIARYVWYTLGELQWTVVRTHLADRNGGTHGTPVGEMSANSAPSRAMCAALRANFPTVPYTLPGKATHVG